MGQAIKLTPNNNFRLLAAIEKCNLNVVLHKANYYGQTRNWPGIGVLKQELAWNTTVLYSEPTKESEFAGNRVRWTVIYTALFGCHEVHKLK